MGKARRRPSRTTPEGRPNDQKTPRWPTWCRWLFFASGWLATAFVNFLEFPEKINSFSENYSSAKETTLNAAIDYQKYIGRFSSDPNSWRGRNLIGDGTHPPDTGEIQLDVEYLGDGKYRGEIHSAHMVKHSLAPWSRVMVDGEVGITGDFQGVVWDIVDNSRAPYALFRLSLKDKSKGSLLLTPTLANNIFPGEIVLWPTDFEMSEGERGQQFNNALLEIVTQSKKTENGQRSLNK